MSVKFNKVLYDKQRYPEIRDVNIARRKQWGIQNTLFRKTLLSSFNCFCCGESDSDLIDWHHVHPKDKLFNVTAYNEPHDKWWNEVLKCIPVCVLCHRKIHTNKLCLMKT